MIKTFELKLYYWNGEWIKHKQYEPKRNKQGKPLKDSQGNIIYDMNKFTVTKKRNLKVIQDVCVKPNNDIHISLASGKKLKLTSGYVVSGEREIDVLNSAFCNEWNVMLPLISYKEEIKKNIIGGGK